MSLSTGINPDHDSSFLIRGIKRPMDPKLQPVTSVERCVYCVSTWTVRLRLDQHQVGSDRVLVALPSWMVCFRSCTVDGMH